MQLFKSNIYTVYSARWTKPLMHFAANWKVLCNWETTANRVTHTHTQH